LTTAGAVAGSRGKGKLPRALLACRNPRPTYTSSLPRFLLLLATLHSRRGIVDEVSSVAGAVVVFPELPLCPPCGSVSRRRDSVTGSDEAVFFLFFSGDAVLFLFFSGDAVLLFVQICYLVPTST
jgi:hypothetical protein